MRAFSSAVDQSTFLNNTCLIATIVAGPMCRYLRVIDDLLQHEKSTNSGLQYRGYNLDSYKFANFVQDKEAEFVVTHYSQNNQ